MNANKTVKSEPTRPLCGMIAIVHRDLNYSSSSESDCIRSDLNKADLHNPECSSVPAGIAVNAPLSVSSALSPLTSLVQSHSASEQVPSVPNNRQQGEYPPRAVTRVRGDLPPPCYDGVNPKGLPSDSASPDCKDGVYPLEGVPSTGGKTLGLVAPLTGVAVSSPVAEFDPSGLVRTGSACHSIASQSSSQSDRTAHTTLSATDSLQEPLDAPRLRDSAGKSMFAGSLSCGRTQSPAHPQSAFEF